MRFFLIFFLLFIINNVQALEIYSIKPEEIQSNSIVDIYGNFDTETLSIFLGKQELKYRIVSQEHLSITIPSNLEPAIYYINFFDSKTGKFIMGVPVKVARPKIKIDRFQPKFLDFCDENRIVEIIGENLDIIKYAYVNGYEIDTFEKSNIQIKMKLPESFFLSLNQNYITITLYDENKNLLELLNIPVNTKPEIESAVILNNFFNYYEIHIKGKNFIGGSKLYVNNIEINQRYSKIFEGIYIFGQQYVTKPQSTTMLHDSFFIEDCNSIILTRYPFSSEEKQLKIQIESPSGQRSQEFLISAP